MSDHPVHSSTLSAVIGAIGTRSTRRPAHTRPPPGAGGPSEDAARRAVREPATGENPSQLDELHAVSGMTAEYPASPGPTPADHRTVGSHAPKLEANGKTAHRQVRLCDSVQTLRRTSPHSPRTSSWTKGLAHDRARRIVGAEVPPNPSLAPLRRVGRLLFAEITVGWRWRLARCLCISYCG
jgi:hypothetical protein